jgi:hypothetical protein
MGSMESSLFVDSSSLEYYYGIEMIMHPWPCVQPGIRYFRTKRSGSLDTHDLLGEHKGSLLDAKSIYR